MIVFPFPPVYMTQHSLLTPFTLGKLQLRNRVVMAPMTRSRASAEQVVPEMTATYYEQRASAGLIVTEATQVSPDAIGYPNTPGVYTDEQVAAWRRVTDAVHESGGRIFVQLWHVGRVADPALRPGGSPPVAASAVAATGQMYTAEGPKPFVVPRALRTDEISVIVTEFANAAARAIEAGFDGVEIHAANGYLIDGFLRDSSNVRTDEYGGSAENRSRFLWEVTEAVVAAIGADRVGVRFSPVAPVNGTVDGRPFETFAVAARGLRRFGLAYLHVIEPATAAGERITPLLAREFGGTVIANGGYTLALADEAIDRGEAELVAFGVPYIANPDLVERFEEGAPLAEGDRATFYGGGAAGYADYETREAVV